MSCGKFTLRQMNCACMLLAVALLAAYEFISLDASVERFGAINGQVAALDQRLVRLAA